MPTTISRAAYILWDVSDRKNWQIVAKGTREECLTAASDDFLNPQMEGMEIHPNEIKNSWNDPINKIHFATYMDGTTEASPMTMEEIEAEK